MPVASARPLDTTAAGGLRRLNLVAMLTYGFVAVTGEAVDIAQLTAFSFGVGATLTAVGFAIAIAILGPRGRRRLAARDRRAAATAPRRGRPRLRRERRPADPA